MKQWRNWAAKACKKMTVAEMDLSFWEHFFPDGQITDTEASNLENAGLGLFLNISEVHAGAILAVLGSDVLFEELYQKEKVMFCGKVAWNHERPETYKACFANSCCWDHKKKLPKDCQQNAKFETLYVQCLDRNKRPCTMKIVILVSKQAISYSEEILVYYKNPLAPFVMLDIKTVQ